MGCGLEAANGAAKRVPLIVQPIPIGTKRKILTFEVHLYVPHSWLEYAFHICIHDIFLVKSLVHPTHGVYIFSFSPEASFIRSTLRDQLGQLEEQLLLQC